MNIVKVDQHSPEDWATQLAMIHHQELSVGLLSKLGLAFLERFYRCAATTNNAIILVALDTNQIQGFICGFQDRTIFLKEFVLKNWLFLMQRAFCCLMSAEIWKRTLQMVFKRNPGKSMDNFLKPELFSFAVDSKAQRKGIGQALFCALKEQFRQIAIYKFKIIASLTQADAIKFYSKMGGKVVDSCHLGPLNCQIFLYES